jgi:hypothetical protein
MTWTVKMICPQRYVLLHHVTSYKRHAKDIQKSKKVSRDHRKRRKATPSSSEEDDSDSEDDTSAKKVGNVSCVMLPLTSLQRIYDRQPTALLKECTGNLMENPRTLVAGRRSN